MITRRERLMRTLRGEPVDRPPVNFYEIGGYKMDPLDPDPFNVYNDLSWQPLLELAEEQTDLIRLRMPLMKRALAWRLDFQKHGGFARIHCHGRLKDILPFFVQMGFDATDPIEPPHQGDVELADVRQQYGKEMVLFGNLEIADLETLSPG